MSDPTTDYGWTARPADSSALFPAGKKKNQDPVPSTAADTPIPSTPLAARIRAYARSKLPPQTFAHSMRVYHYGIAIARQQFPEWGFSPGSALEETYFLACALHDIGTTPENLRATRLSFEFYGGFLALDLLQHPQNFHGSEEGKQPGGCEGQHPHTHNHGSSEDGSSSSAPVEQAESVAEAIILHQDIRKVGKLTTVGALLQLATILDNMGMHGALVHRSTIEAVTKEWPRGGWSGCFARTIREENGLKPWAHTTALGEDDFPNGVLGNKLMAEFD